MSSSTTKAPRSRKSALIAAKVLNFGSQWVAVPLMAVTITVGFWQVLQGLLLGLGWDATIHGKHQAVPTVLGGLELVLLAPLGLIILAALSNYAADLYDHGESGDRTKHSLVHVKGFLIGLLMTVVATHLVGEFLKEAPSDKLASAHPEELKEAPSDKLASAHPGELKEAPSESSAGAHPFQFNNRFPYNTAQFGIILFAMLAVMFVITELMNRNMRPAQPQSSDAEPKGKAEGDASLTSNLTRAHQALVAMEEKTNDPVT